MTDGKRRKVRLIMWTKLYRGGTTFHQIRKEGKHWDNLLSDRISERRSEAVNREVISRG